MQGDRYLKKELSFFDLVIIGVVGAIGTGILFSTAGMTGIAGPGSILAWLIGGIFYLFIGLTYVELSSLYPEAGGPSRYSLYTHGRMTNLINAFSDLLWYIFIPPVEALAVVEGLSAFVKGLIVKGLPTFGGAALGVALMLVFIPFNYFGVKAFGRSTVAIGIVKLVLYLAVAFGLVFVFFDSGNLTSYHGFIPFGMSGVFLAIPLAMFAFGGIRVLPDYAEETKSRKKLPAAIVIVVIGQLLIYLLYDFVFVTGINWSKLGLVSGNWASVGAISGNPFIAIADSYNVGWLLILTLIIGIIGPFVVGYIYLGGGSRVLFAMGRSGVASRSMKGLSETYSIPYVSLIALAIVGAVVAFVAAPLPNIYGLITDSVVAGYIGFSANPVAMTVSRRQGMTKEMLPLGSVIAPVAFVAASLIVYWSGWLYVSYSVLLLLIGVVVFAIAFRVRENIMNSLWYIAYIAFLLAMTYIGSTGALSILNFYQSSLVVVIVSVAIFYPWGVLSGLSSKFDTPKYTSEAVPGTE
ncbi:MAG: APC family permease [Candidatus Thermoplasmatota archaeon]|jgi:amino acid transporter|nr:APC family permease [Candidatus Sysuiplasma jiujiangense]MBX8639565.1 APC family permease [Candidatus Sysuiplasma jiujiangense]MCL4317107.1 APC family permease [Candidatus Thermoplasmatota archaeon]MCL5254002.1 APC family permease [Candidatus Thermoplasmatota archaeon]